MSLHIAHLVDNPLNYWYNYNMDNIGRRGEFLKLLNDIFIPWSALKKKEQKEQKSGKGKMSNEDLRKIFLKELS